MYKIIIKGKREPFEVEDSQGEALLNNWKNNTLSERVEIQDAIFNSDEIKSIYKTNEPISKKDGTGYIAKIKKEHNERKQRKLNNPERYKDLNVARFVWFAHTGSHEIPEDIKSKIIERQKQYLKENPDKVYANPICYKDIAKANRKTVRDKETYQKAIMSFVERITC